ncbi:Bifunctional epoxide hydrolase 2 [Apodemus speciosus]|uniref:Bifunctional epoxide hydrolase 2 n=1 Tax=Apodemus speciosus TaxID=105296 RepID=A0ABQ0FIC5_APOSI
MKAEEADGVLGAKMRIQMLIHLSPNSPEGTEREENRRTLDQTSAEAGFLGLSLPVSCLSQLGAAARAAMALRVAAFDLDGVLALPSIAGALRRTEEALALPRDFLLGAFQTEFPEGPTEQLMKGKITFSQWVPLMDESCRKSSKARGASLPENFSIREIFSQAMAARSINRPMLQAAVALKKKGFTTCIVTNNWLDDSDKRDSLAQMMCELGQHFDFLIESCQVGMIKPEPQIYKFVLDTLKVKPNEVVFLDDFGSNLKPARDMGMTTILVRDTTSALRELEKVTGTQFPEDPLPIQCSPNDVSHGYVTVKPGTRLHFVEMGSGPAICLCHGFPESWFSWRYQIPALAQAGFRVLAIDMKGYGDSSSPPEIEEYAMELLCKTHQKRASDLITGGCEPPCGCWELDSGPLEEQPVLLTTEPSLQPEPMEMVTFLDKLGIPQAVFIGHDWAGVLVWNMALFHPERVRSLGFFNYKAMAGTCSRTHILKRCAVCSPHDMVWSPPQQPQPLLSRLCRELLDDLDPNRAVASLNTPFMPPNPDVSPMKFIESIPVFNYQLYFQKPVGVAEAELEKNMSRTFKSFFRTSDEMDLLTVQKATEMEPLTSLLLPCSECLAGETWAEVLPTENSGLCRDCAGRQSSSKEVRHEKFWGILVDTPEDPRLSKITTEEEIEFYVQQFKKSGFRGPLNWYRNTERNWKWNCKGLGRKILIPALMVTAEKDIVLRPEMSKNMEEWIPFLKRGHIEDCGHWTQIEKPAEVNQILIKWLQTEVQNPSVPSKI